MTTYGRLDVYWPDGPMESYELSKPTVAIGRSPGNDLPLEAAAVSRYHATISLRDGEVFLQDLGSINGTYVNGQRLPPDEPYNLQSGEEIQIGELRLIFYTVDASQADILLDETTQRIAYQVPTFQVELIGLDQPVTPGVFVQGKLVIHNLGDEPDRYFIEIDGVPREWVRLERVEAILEPGQEAHLMLSFKPLRRPDTAPGDYTFTVQVRSKSRPTQTVDARMTLHVLPYSGFGIDLGRNRIAAGQTLPIFVHNQGNAPLDLSFAGRDERRILRFAFTPATLRLGPGQRQTVQARVETGRALLLGARRDLPFVVMARAHDASGFIAALPARVAVEPILTGWRLGAAVGAVLTGLLALAVLLALLLAPPPPPQIVRLGLSTAEIVAGDPLTLSWEVRDAAALYLEVDGVRRGEAITAADSGVSFSLSAPGPHEITLVAVNGDAVTRESVQVQVHERLAIASFTAQPPIQVRYVSQPVVLSWEVPGGIQVQLLGLPGDDVNALYGPADSRQVRLEGLAPVTVTLRALGGAGQVAEQSLTLPVEDPVCAVVEEGTAVRAGPSNLHTLLGTASAGQMIVPDMRDGSGQWLRVFANDDRRVWVAAAALQCLNLDPMNLRVDPAPPTPVPTDTASPSPTSTVTASPSPALTATPTALPTATPPPTPKRGS